MCRTVVPVLSTGALAARGMAVFAVVPVSAFACLLVVGAGLWLFLVEVGAVDALGAFSLLEKFAWFWSLGCGWAFVPARSLALSIVLGFFRCPFYCGDAVTGLVSRDK